MLKKPTNLVQLKPANALAKRAKELYPSSVFMQEQWTKKTQELMKSGKHLLAKKVERCA